MSIFGTIMNAIFHHANAAPTSGASGAPDAAGASAATPSATPTPDAAGASASTPSAAPASTGASAPAGGGASVQNVDVGAVLSQLAAQRGGGGNYQSSIVDLLKLLDLDSSLTARKELANELDVHAGADGSAEENIALHKAVMQKLAENGGKVPDSLRD